MKVVYIMFILITDVLLLIVTMTNDRPVLSSERAPPPTQTKYQMSDSNQQIGIDRLSD
jgi:hypothetical protein